MNMDKIEPSSKVQSQKQRRTQKEEECILVDVPKHAAAGDCQRDLMQDGPFEVGWQWSCFWSDADHVYLVPVRDERLGLSTNSRIRRVFGVSDHGDAPELREVILSV